MKRLQLLLLWVWMVCFSAASHDYMFKQLEVKDGLSNNQVNAIYKDSNGFMWFGTASGLNRYDGYNIKIYRSQKDDEKSLPDSYVEDIQEDTSGNLWIRTGGGYAIYNSASDVIDRNVEAWMWNDGLPGNPRHENISRFGNNGRIPIPSITVSMFGAIEGARNTLPDSFLKALQNLEPLRE